MTMTMTMMISVLPPKILLLLVTVLVLLAAEPKNGASAGKIETKQERRKRLGVPDATNSLIRWIQDDVEGGFYWMDQKEMIRDYSGGVEETVKSEGHGTYAKMTFQKGSVLLKLPRSALLGGGRHKDIDNNNDNDDDDHAVECRLIRLVYREVAEKGKDSKFASHLRYLGLLDDDDAVAPSIPALWSDAGKRFLKDLGHLPQGGIEGPLDQLNDCLVGLEDDKELATKVAAVVAAHGASGDLLTKHGLLVPFLDNYHYAHCGNSNPTVDPNVKIVADPYSETVFLETTQKIAPGVQICRSFDAAAPMTEMEKLVNLGISNNKHYPKTFSFVANGLESDTKVEVHWKEATGNGFEPEFFAEVTTDNLRNEEYFERMAILIEDELRRFQNFGTGGEEDTMPRREYAAVMKQRENLVRAMELAYENLEDQDLDDEDMDQNVGTAGEL